MSAIADETAKQLVTRGFAPPRVKGSMASPPGTMPRVNSTISRVER